MKSSCRVIKDTTVYFLLTLMLISCASTAQLGTPSEVSLIVDAGLDAIEDATFSSDEKFCVTYYRDNFSVWSIDSLKKVAVYTRSEWDSKYKEFGTRWRNTLRFQIEQNLDKEQIYVLSNQVKDTLFSFPGQAIVKTAVSTTNNIIYIGCEGGIVYVVDMNAKSLKVLDLNLDKTIWSIQVSQTGDYAYFSIGTQVPIRYDLNKYLADLSYFEGKGKKTDFFPPEIVLSAFGKYLLERNEDNTVRVWDVITGGLIGEIGQTNSTEFWEFISKGSNQLIIGSNDGSLLQWDFESGDCEIVAKNKGYSYKNIEQFNEMITSLDNGLINFYSRPDYKKTRSLRPFKEIKFEKYSELPEVVMEYYKNDTLLISGGDQILLYDYSLDSIVNKINIPEVSLGDLTRTKNMQILSNDRLLVDHQELTYQIWSLLDTKLLEERKEFGNHAREASKSGNVFSLHNINWDVRKKVVEIIDVDTGEVKFVSEDVGLDCFKNILFIHGDTLLLTRGPRARISDLDFYQLKDDRFNFNGSIRTSLNDPNFYITDTERYCVGKARNQYVLIDIEKRQQVATLILLPEGQWLVKGKTGENTYSEGALKYINFVNSDYSIATKPQSKDQIF